MKTSHSETRPLRIFVVENHDDTRRCLTQYLQQMGHTVVSAATMEEALGAIPCSDCSVLISDIGLPDGDGWELLERLQLASSLYTIAMSGYGMNADRARSTAAGFRHHILKPFDPDQLDLLLEEAAHETVT